MNLKNLAVVALALHALSCGIARAEGCKEQSLVKFLSGGEETLSQVVGLSPECDNFGGNLTYTPKHNIFLYVNFNNAGTIDLDKIDAALDAIPTDNKYYDYLKAIELVVVEKDWIKNKHHHDGEVSPNMTGQTFFISAKVLEEGRFEAVVADIYNTALGK